MPVPGNKMMDALLGPASQLPGMSQDEIMILKALGLDPGYQPIGDVVKGPFGGATPGKNSFGMLGMAGAGKLSPMGNPPFSIPSIAPPMGSTGWDNAVGQAMRGGQLRVK